MRRTTRTLLILAVCLALMLSASAPAAASAFAKPVALRSDVPAAADSVPHYLIENVAQFDQRARFQMRTQNGTLWVTDDALWLTRVQASAPLATGETQPNGSTLNSPFRNKGRSLATAALRHAPSRSSPVTRPRHSLSNGLVR